MIVSIDVESFVFGIICGIVIALFSKILDEWRRLKKRVEGEKK